MFQQNAQPSADARYMKPTAFSVSRDPNRSPGTPATSAPINVPNNALATAKPAQKLPGSRWNSPRTDSVTPEITPVPKPNSSPASLGGTIPQRFLHPPIPPPAYIYVSALLTKDA